MSDTLLLTNDTDSPLSERLKKSREAGGEQMLLRHRRDANAYCVWSGSRRRLASFAWWTKLLLGDDLRVTNAGRCSSLGPWPLKPFIDSSTYDS